MREFAEFLGIFVSEGRIYLLFDVCIILLRNTKSRLVDIRHQVVTTTGPFLFNVNVQTLLIFRNRVVVGEI